MSRKLETLTEREVLALAIRLEEESTRRGRLIEAYTQRFGDHMPPIRPRERPRNRSAEDLAIPQRPAIALVASIRRWYAKILITERT